MAPEIGKLDPRVRRVVDGVGAIHVVNAGGAGMGAIAAVLAQRGHAVSGVDANDTPFLERLRALDVDVAVAGSHPAAVRAALVVTSTATPVDHPDVVAATAAGTPVVHRREVLDALGAHRTVLAVAGTHGKSTTTGMLATIVARCNGDGFLAGTTVAGLGSNAEWRDGPGFVVEADESDGTFLRLQATHGIVTNLEADHLSCWGTEDALVDGFRRFVSALDGHAVLCVDDAGAAALVDAADRPLTYGTDPAADHRIVDPITDGIGIRYRHVAPDGTVVPVHVPAAPGIHNARNAAAALVGATTLGIDLEDAAEALGAFRGVARRFEVRGEAHGVTFVDSYDHLPTEIRAALAAAAGGGFGRVVCVFQPHRYTRTRDLAPTFADAFVDADVLAVTELYGAGEVPIPGVTGRLVLDAVRDAHPDEDVAYLADLDEAVAWLDATLRPGDLCLTLNAGDLTTVPDRVLAAWAAS